MNRRIAEHKGRKPATTGQDAPTETQHPAGSRAAQAAARVAARYAKAPSYSEMLADEARAAVRAAEAASRAALEAQAAAESVLAGLEAASSETQAWEPEFSIAPDSTPEWTLEPEKTAAQAPPATGQPAKKQSFAILWDDDMPVRESAPALSHPSQFASTFQPLAETLWDQMPEERSPLQTDGFELVEPAQPIHANLIEFPRELVATRKLRPRRAEGPYAASYEGQGQLSIFEVEPWTISTEPEAPGAASEVGTANWVGPEWSGIELDEEPEIEDASTPPPPARLERSVPETVVLKVAPINRRIMAFVVDFSLIVGAFVAAASLASASVNVLPSIRAIEKGSAAALALTALFYLAVFFTMARATPGMKYAHIEIRTFAGERPTRAQRCGRMAALLLSVLPMGLGMVWSLFDDQHLCLHDRLSRTYPRMG